MTIAAVSGQNAGNAGAASSASQAFSSNVSVDSLIVVYGAQVHTGNAGAFVAGDCTASAGTATLGTISLDSSNYINAVQGYAKTGVWSAIVTGAGSLTMQVSDTGGGSPGTAIGIHEYTGDWDSSRVEDSSNSSNAADNDTAAETGNGTSAGDGLFAANIMTFGATTPAVTEDGAFTLVDESSASAAGAIIQNAIFRISSGGLTDEGAWTLGNNLGWSASLAVYKEADAGIIPLIMHHRQMMS